MPQVSVARVRLPDASVSRPIVVTLPSTWLRSVRSSNASAAVQRGHVTVTARRESVKA